MTTIEELEAVYKSVFLDNPKSDHRIFIHKHQADVIRETLTQAIAIKKGECVVSREMRLTIEGMAKQPLTTEMDDVAQWSADYTDGYDEMVKHARKLKAMIAAQEEQG